MRILAILLGAQIFLSSQMPGAQMELTRSAGVFCPAAGARITIGLLNRTGAPQTIAAGTLVRMEFSFPVTEVPFSPSSVEFSFFHNTLTARFLTDVTAADGTGVFFNSVALLTQGANGRTPIAVSATAEPANALVFTQSRTAIVGMADPGACQAAAQSVLNLESLTSVCPTAAEVNVFRAALDLRLDANPSAGTLVCRAADGSADLTRLEERTFQAYRLMEFLPFDAPLPWTPKPLYDWFTGAIRGIRYRSDIANSFCCDPPGYINIMSSVGVLEQPTNPAVVISLADLLIHEARHNDGPAHTCGTWDQTLPELGAWGAVFYYNEWAAFRTGDFLKSKMAGQAAKYESWAWGSAQGALTAAICDHGGGVVVSPAAVDFGGQAVGAASVARTVAITQTEGGALTVATVSVEGQNAGDFAITSAPCAGATAPPSCAVVVRFTPQAAGLRLAQLRVALVKQTLTGQTLPGQLTERVATLSGTGSASAPVCSYGLSSLGESVGGGGGYGTVAIAAGDGCEWEAASDAAWLSIASGGMGSGKGTLAYVAAANPGFAARTGKVTVAGLTFTVSQGATVVTISDARSASGYGGTANFAAGSWMEITGTSLAFSTREWRASDFNGDNAPTSLDGVSVSINGKPGFIYFIKPDDQNGPSQVNVQAPGDTTLGPVAIVVRNSAGVSQTYYAPKTELAPGMLAPPSFRVGGRQYVVANFPGEYTFVGNDGLVAGAPFRPAKPGDMIWLYGIGFGDVTPALEPGVIDRQTERLNAQVSFQFGPIPVKPDYAGMYPGYVGLYLFFVTVPDLPDGDQPVTVLVNGVVAAGPSLYLTVKR